MPFDRYGFAIIEQVLSPARVAALIEATRAYATGGHDGALDRCGEVYGGRDLLWRVPEVFSLAHSPEILPRIQAILVRAAFPVRGRFSDKTLTSNCTRSVPVPAWLGGAAFGPARQAGGRTLTTPLSIGAARFGLIDRRAQIACSMLRCRRTEARRPTVGFNDQDLGPMSIETRLVEGIHSD